MASPRPLRADAARNRQRVLAAAAAELAERGPDAAVADIARRAGVGKGTVFRHFPSREHLIDALVLDQLGGLISTGERLTGEPDAGAGLLEFLTDAAARRQQLDLSLLSGTQEGASDLAAARARAFEIIDTLVGRAHEQGSVRPDVTGADVALLMCTPNEAVRHMADPPPGLWRRYLGILFDGLRPDGAHPLPHPPPASLSDSGDGHEGDAEATGLP